MLIERNNSLFTNEIQPKAGMYLNILSYFRM